MRPWMRPVRWMRSLALDIFGGSLRLAKLHALATKVSERLMRVVNIRFMAYSCLRQTEVWRIAQHGGVRSKVGVGGLGVS